MTIKLLTNQVSVTEKFDIVQLVPLNSIFGPTDTIPGLLDSKLPAFILDTHLKLD